VGVFSAWQPKYATVGIATVPVDPETKVPLVGNWQKMGFRASTELASKPRFEECDGIAFVCGAWSGITILDIDVADESVLRLGLERHGDSPLIERTASGKFHVWYRHNGEPREIKRLWGADEPIDLLGAGLSIAYPTTRSDGASYSFYRGGLADVADLPVIAFQPWVRQSARRPHRFSEKRKMWNGFWLCEIFRSWSRLRFYRSR
jgi:hypothetical protein